MLTEAFIVALKDKLSQDYILTDPAECMAYSYDNSRHHAMPEAVVLPSNPEHIQSTILLCHEYNIPITVRGRGTGTTGGAVPINHGIVISLERMTEIINVDPANRCMVVEAGVLNATVQAKAAEHNMFWSPDPSSSKYCTVGGNLACNAAGPRALKYGATRENVLGLSAITGEGMTIKTGVNTTKGAVGYDLTRLLIGSEGTLAVITQATLKLLPLAESTMTILALYEDVSAATDALTSIMAQSIIPCALEFMDTAATALIRDNPATSHYLPKNIKAVLLIEIDGSPHTLPYDFQKIKDAATNLRLLSITSAQSKDESQQLWGVRKALSQAMRAIAPQKINEDVVVPVANIPRLISYVEQLAAKYQIPIVCFGHAGNGNIHVNLLVHPDNINQQRNIHACLHDLFEKVLQLNGTLSGEHGIGIEKRAFMKQAIDANTLIMMKKIKQQFDPRGILNPGKLF